MWVDAPVHLHIIVPYYALWKATFTESHVHVIDYLFSPGARDNCIFNSYHASILHFYFLNMTLQHGHYIEVSPLFFVGILLKSPQSSRGWRL